LYRCAVSTVICTPYFAPMTGPPWIRRTLRIYPAVVGHPRHAHQRRDPMPVQPAQLRQRREQLPADHRAEPTLTTERRFRSAGFPKARDGSGNRESVGSLAPMSGLGAVESTLARVGPTTRMALA
jgi:hypothetical protein